MPNKPAFRPNAGGSLRPQAEAPRHRFLYIHVTKEEEEKIQQYCSGHNISVSQFLSEVVIADAMKAQPKRKEKVVITLEIEMAPEELEKLELLAKFHQKNVGQLVYELIKPNFDLQRLHSPVERTPLRYYLSDYEYHIVTTHLANKGMAARYYPVTLALKAIAAAEQEKRK